MFTLEKQNWDQRVRALLIDLDSLSLAIADRNIKGMDLHSVYVNIRQARMLIEMGWFVWRPEENWRRDAVALMRETKRVYTLADPNSSNTPLKLEEAADSVAIEILGVLSSAEAVMSLLVGQIAELPELDVFTATEMIRLFQGAREQLIFAIFPPFNYLQGMAVPISPDWGVNIEEGAIGLA